MACLGGVGGGDVDRAPVVVALVQSASRTDLTTRAGMTTLVADEVHRYGADSWSSALRPGYTNRLGLTATLERADDRVDRHIRPYFGATVMTYLFEEAITDVVVAPFRLVMAPVAMRSDEQEQYDAESTTLSARCPRSERRASSGTTDHCLSSSPSWPPGPTAWVGWPSQHPWRPRDAVCSSPSSRASSTPSAGSRRSSTRARERSSSPRPSGWPRGQRSA